MSPCVQISADKNICGYLESCFSIPMDWICIRSGFPQVHF